MRILFWGGKDDWRYVDVMINMVLEFIEGGVDIYLLFCDTAGVVTLNASPFIGEFEWKDNCIDGIRYHAGVLYRDEVEGEFLRDIEPILEEYTHVNGFVFHGRRGREDFT